jgi:hypothetical protein
MLKISKGGFLEFPSFLKRGKGRLLKNKFTELGVF